MPIHKGKDNKGHYYQFGNQKKYYFTTDRGERISFFKALKQSKAIKANQIKN